MNVDVLKSTLVLVFMVLASAVKGQVIGLADEKQIEVSMRMIGHELLLSSGDSTSRVLPVYMEEGGYRILFENDFALKPAELVSIVGRVLYKSGMTNEYVVEVEDCDSNKVVYAFKVDNTTNSDIIPCRRRDLPLGCYTVLISLPAQNISTGATAEGNSVQADTEESNLFIWLFIGFTLVIIIASAFRRKKKKVPQIKNPNLISLGKYHFDKLNGELIIEEQRIELTSKEADLLELLYDTVNTTVEREVLLNKVWGDEGDYIGRTLDVFISKLRKKLEFDSEVKIVNVRGVGYKLVMAV